MITDIKDYYEYGYLNWMIKNMIWQLLLQLHDCFMGCEKALLSSRFLI